MRVSLYLVGVLGFATWLTADEHIVEEAPLSDPRARYAQEERLRLQAEAARLAARAASRNTLRDTTPRERDDVDTTPLERDEVDTTPYDREAVDGIRRPTYIRHPGVRSGPRR